MKLEKIVKHNLKIDEESEERSVKGRISSQIACASQRFFFSSDEPKLTYQDTPYEPSQRANIRSSRSLQLIFDVPTEKETVLTNEKKCLEAKLVAAVSACVNLFYTEFYSSGCPGKCG